MDMNQFNLPVSMLRQYCFCPRIPYFYIARNITPVEKEWMSQGIEEHKRQEMLSKRRNLSRFGISTIGKISFNVELYSDQLSLHGICDAILSADSELSIIEFKNSDYDKFTIGTAVQLCAYAMLCEEKYGEIIKQCFVLYGSKGKTRKVNIDASIRSKTLEIRDHIIKKLKKADIPPSSAEENKCGQCEFFNFCADRF